ncbi:MAG TPA: N-acetylmuramoyl-L-alanine amidase [bacterium]|nr:N-acetylmuramoyl-L-alanine amidase [bacterium]
MTKKIISFLLLLFFSGLSALDIKTVTVKVETVRNGASSESRETLHLIGGMGYFDADTVKKIYGLPVRIEGDALVLGEKITLKADSVSVLFGRDKRSLRKELKRIEGEFYVPLELFLTKAFTSQTKMRSFWNYSESSLKVVQEGKHDYVRFQSFTEFDRVYLELRRKQKVVMADKDGKVALTLSGADFFPPAGITSELIKDVDISRGEKGILILVTLTEKAGIYELKELNRDWVLDVYTKQEPPAVPKKLSQPLRPEAGRKEKIETVVLDPGHGGKDPGAVGRRGLREKDVNLAIAKRVEKKLKSRGFKVVMTRGYDVYLPLSQRTILANRREGHAFVSIHCNSSHNPNTCGVEVFFMSDKASDQEAGKVAQFENAVLDMEEEELEENKLNQLLWSMAINRFMNESSLLGKALLDEMKEYFPSLQRGVKQAGFHVLKGVQMPSVLIEVGFLSNSREEKLLSKKKYQEKIAQAICQGICDYVKIKEK